MNKKSTRIKPNIVKFIKFACLFILFIASFLIIAKSYAPAIDNSKVLLSYSSNNSASYRVNLKENDFYEESTLGMNKRYVASLIDTIDVDFSHSLSGSKEMDLDFTYTITAYISSVFNDSNDNAEIWKKSYILKSPVKKEIKDANSYTINEHVSIDYAKYNDIANEYKSSLSLPVESYLYVVLNVNTTGGIKESEKPILDNNKIEVKIPLSVSTLAITTDYPTNKINALSSNDTSKTSINFITLAFGLILLVFTVVPAYKSYDDFKNATRKTEFVIKLNKILRDYEEIIAEIADLPELDQYQVLDVKVFRDMVDIQAELHVPILYYKLREAVGGVFLIIHENKAYRYYIREDGIKNKIV